MASLDVLYFLLLMFLCVTVARKLAPLECLVTKDKFEDVDIVSPTSPAILTMNERVKLRCKKPFYESIAYSTCAGEDLFTALYPPCKRICVIYGNFDSELPRPRDIKKGDNVTLRCKSNYLEGTTWSVCNEEGRMSTPEPKCKLVKCPIPGPLPHGRVDKDFTNTGVALLNDRIHNTCDEDYWFTGTQTRSCQRNRTWSGQDGTCEAVRCTPPPPLDHGKYKEDPPFIYNSTLTAGCDEGYVYNGTDRRICQGDNLWSGQNGTCISMQTIECSLMLQKNRFITGRYNQVIDFKCKKGFTYNGTRRRTCLVNSTWSGMDGTCNPIFCRKPSGHIENGWIVGCDKCKYRSTLRVICDTGYQQNGSVLVCNEDGNWNGSIGHCKDILCTAPVGVPNGHINISGSSYKSTGVVTCNTGYTIIDHNVVHCQDDGTWSQPGSCQESSKHVQTAEVLGGLIGALIFSMAIVFFYLYFLRRQIRRHKQALSDPEFGKVITTQGHIVDRRYDRKIDLDTEYIKLCLLDDNGKDAKRIISDHTMPYLGHGEGKEVDLEELILKAEAGSKIMLVGRAGVGKSTLVQKTIRRWAQGEWGKNYKYIFLLSVRHLAVIENREMTLRDLLVKYNVYARDKMTYDDFDVDDENQSMLLFIDGLDEFPDLRGKLKDFEQTKLNYDDVGMSHGLVVQVLKRKFLPNSTLILTSRPFKGLGQLKPYQGVEVYGLTRSTLMEFIDKNVQGVSYEKREQIKAEFTRNPILQSVSSITFFCMMLCQAFKGKLDHNGTQEELKTYTRLTCFIMQRYMARAPLEEECNEQHTPLLSDQATRDFTPFSKLAFLGLVERRNNSDIARLVFDEKDLHTAGLTDQHRKKGESSGFLLSTEYTGEDGKEKILVEFAHLSIQELLAMVHLLNQPDNTLIESFSKMWTSGCFNMAQLYLFGLQFDTNSDRNTAFIKSMCLSTAQQNNGAKLKSGLINHLKTDEKLGRYAEMCAIQIAYESQCSDLAYEVGKILFTKTGEVSFRDMTLSAVDMNAVLFMIQQTEKCNHQESTDQGTITKLKLVRMKIDDACIRILSSFIRVGIIKNLSLDGNALSYEGLKVLMDAVITSSTLRSISLQSTDIGNDSIHLVADMLQANSSLEKASLGYNRFDGKGTEYLAYALRSRKKSLQLIMEKDRQKQVLIEKELGDINHIQITWNTSYENH